MTADIRHAGRANYPLLPAAIGLGLFAMLLFGAGNSLLRDADCYWQVALGQWIVDHRAVPVSDVFSFTMRGQPWISTQWLAQILLSESYRWIGWAGPVVLSSLSVAAAFALLTQFLQRRLSDKAVLVLLLLAFVNIVPHLQARPHALALPFVVAWIAVLLSAAERKSVPALPYVFLIAIWANLHGSFLFGLMMIGPIALEAVVYSEPSARRALVLRWMVFGFAALAASCLNPYGWNALLAARNILALGGALDLIGEWKPVDFSKPGPLSVTVLLAFAAALLSGARLPPLRAAVVAGLVYMALSHVRNADMLGLLAPMIVAAPLAAQFRAIAASDAKLALRFPQFAGVAVLGLAIAGSAISLKQYTPAPDITPVAAIDVLKARGAARILNDYDFGGYMIARGVPPYIDGRTELYGEAFTVQHDNATMLKRPEQLFRILDEQRIDATLLHRVSPAALLLDRLNGWRKIFSDDNVVVHVRDASAVQPSNQK